MSFSSSQLSSLKGQWRVSNLRLRSQLFCCCKIITPQTQTQYNPTPNCYSAFSTSAKRLNSSSDKKGSPTYYTLFPKTFPDGPPPKGPFKFSASDLRNEYLKLQALAHPDRLGPKATNTQRQNAENKSAQLSVAYRTLLSPLRRSQHLIACREGISDPLSEDAGSPHQKTGEEIASEEAAATTDSGVIDEDFLMDVLMARESVEEASSAEELRALMEENNQRISATEEALDAAFKKDDLEEATDLTRKLSYWEGIDRQLQEEIEPYE